MWVLINFFAKKKLNNTLQTALLNSDFISGNRMLIIDAAQRIKLKTKR